MFDFEHKESMRNNFKLNDQICFSAIKGIKNISSIHVVYMAWSCKSEVKTLF